MLLILLYHTADSWLCRKVFCRWLCDLRECVLRLFAQIGREGFEIYSGSQMMNLKGINYFGFEDGQTSFDGLWQGPTALTYGDYHPPTFAHSSSFISTCS